MRGASAAGRAAGAGDRLVHDLADGARATPALRAAAEAAVDFTGRTRRGRSDGMAHLVVAEHVAGTDDHEAKDPSARLLLQLILNEQLRSSLRQVKEFQQFEIVLSCWPGLPIRA